MVTVVLPFTSQNPALTGQVGHTYYAPHVRETYMQTNARMRTIGLFMYVVRCVNEFDFSIDSHIHRHTYMHTCTHAHRQTHTCLCILVPTRSCMHTHTHMRACSHTCTHTSHGYDVSCPNQGCMQLVHLLSDARMRFSVVFTFEVSWTKLKQKHIS